jgi:hypothetical protein
MGVVLRVIQRSRDTAGSEATAMLSAQVFQVIDDPDSAAVSRGNLYKNSSSSEGRITNCQRLKYGAMFPVNKTKS